MTILCRLRSSSEIITLGLQNVTASANERVKARSTARRLRALFTDTEGQSAVESALVIFLVFTPMIIGLFSCILALISYQQLGYATMNATQTLAAGRGVLTDPCKTAATVIAGFLPTWTPANFTYTVTITSTVDAVNSTTSYGPYSGSSAATCTSAATTLTNAIGDSNGNPVTLHMSYTYNWFPLFGRKITGTLVAEDTMLVG